MSHFSRKSIAGLAFIVAAAAGILVFMGGSQASVAATPANGEASFSALKRPVNASDNVSDWRVTPRTMGSHQPDVGMDPAGTRVLRRDSKLTLAAIPADGTACLAMLRGRNQAVACGTNEDPTTAIILYGWAVGMVPDTVQHVTFHLTDASVETVSVTGNLWEAPAEADSVTFTLNGSEKVVDLMPGSSLPAGATISADGIVSTASE